MKTALVQPRKYISEDLIITWENLEPIFSSLQSQEIVSLDSLKNWLAYRSEIEAVISEDFAWRYINMTRDTTDEKLAQEFQYFTTEIEPKIAAINNDLDKKLVNSKYIDELTDSSYAIYIRKVKKSLEIFREENIPLFTEMQIKQQKYQTIIGGLSVIIDGKEITLQQATAILLENDREKREKAWRLINNKRLEKKDELNNIFNELLTLRQKIAINAGFSNYRDYMFAALGRFDYTIVDCQNFHQAIEQVIVPILKEIASQRKEKLKVDKLKPWDMAVDADNLPALKPFTAGQELIDKTKEAFQNIDAYIGNCISIMEENNLFDVESRLGKAPGGYNYPLYESGAPFIFMNAAGTLRDLTTMIHEGGHAVHTFISSNLPLTEFKNLPSEVAELASMSMELISMDQWNLFFKDPEELRRAKIEQLQDALSTLPWVATIDKFQHWLYTNPNHSEIEREKEWLKIYREFGGGFTDSEEEIEVEKNLWHKQLHLFEVPFYYIEYGFAQLGAIAIWKNYLIDKKTGISKYLDALKLGYTKTIPEIYETAGIKFDFEKKYIKELANFLENQIKKL